jgi:NADH dehydrogenase FAD-containing subunit
MQKKVVIIGGGFAGAFVAKHLEKEFSVTLIDTKDYFEYTPGILRAIAHPETTTETQVLHKQYLKHARVIVGTATSVNEDYVQVGKQKISYDYLVIASGCKYTQLFRQHNVITTERGQTLRDQHEKLKKAKKILIVGGGIVGVEAAGEIVHGFPGTAVTIVHSRDQLVQNSSPRVVAAVTNWLVRHGVNIVYGERIQEAKGKKFLTKSGKELAADIVLLCVGNRPNVDYLSKELLDERTCVLTDEYLRLSGKENVFVGGDVTNIKEAKLAQNAQKHAGVIADNIRRTDRGQTLRTYRTGTRPSLISLGDDYAVFSYHWLCFSGRIPALMKRFLGWQWRKQYA